METVASTCLSSRLRKRSKLSSLLRFSKRVPLEKKFEIPFEGGIASIATRRVRSSRGKREMSKFRVDFFKYSVSVTSRSSESEL